MNKKEDKGGPKVIKRPEYHMKDIKENKRAMFTLLCISMLGTLWTMINADFRIGICYAMMGCIALVGISYIPLYATMDLD